MTAPASHMRDSGGRDGVTLDAEARCLLWRCRRGMKELDVVLERYVGITLPGASGQERGELARLLELPDPELAGYLLGGRLPQDPGLAALIERILAFCGAVKCTTGEAGSVAPRKPNGA